MVHAQDDPSSPQYHPFWYARVIGIFDVDVRWIGDDGVVEPRQKMYFLWVQWFGRDSTYRSGVGGQRLDRVGFIHDEDDTEPFGFVDPACVIRAVHLIPAFEHGHTAELLGPSIGRRDNTQTEDWCFYYVNRYE